MAEREVAVLIDKKTGDINNIRDKKLADSASQQSVASTDAIRMTTTTGEEVYIARDSFVQAIASVLNSNSQSTITTLFGADANGNHANINMANLASVLSAIISGAAGVDGIKLAQLRLGSLQSSGYDGYLEYVQVVKNSSWYWGLCIRSKTYGYRGYIMIGATSTGDQNVYFTTDIDTFSSWKKMT